MGVGFVGGIVVGIGEVDKFGFDGCGYGINGIGRLFKGVVESIYGGCFG